MNSPCKLLFLLLLLLVQVPVNAQGTWERINVPTNKSLNSLFFTDSLYGWIAGDSGTIIHTSDGGKNWTFQNSGTNNNVVFVFFLNRNLGWASSQNYSTFPYGTVLLKTTNGGSEWTKVPYPADDIFITCILYRDSLNGWMGGKPNALVRTTDGGITWTQASIDTSILAFFPVLNIRFYNEKYGYACGGMFDIAGVIWRTSNGGDLWNAIDSSEAPADEVHDLYLFDSIHVMGAGGDPDFGYGVGMIRTSDGGMNWNYQELGMQGTAYDLDFRNQKECWAPLGSGRKLIYSMDTGNTWTAIPTPDSTAITRMMFPDSLHGFAVGKKGAVIKYKLPVSGLVVPAPIQGHDGLILFQNYPNPFTSDTKIKFTVPANAKVHTIYLQIKVFTIFGKEIATPVHDMFQPGEYEVTLEGANLQSGIYYYRLYAKAPQLPVLFTAPKKMILIR
jgi:photosystem II stability/assembly factor-like uncharacterized protein